MKKSNAISLVVGLGLGVAGTKLYPKAKDWATKKYLEYKNKKNTAETEECSTNF